MANFFEENKGFFVEQIALFEQASLPKNNTEKTSTDTVISARVRPLLPHEKELGEVVGAIARSEDASVNIHELKKKIKGSPTLSSTTFHLDKVYGPLSVSHKIYSDLVSPLIPWAMGGGVSTLFAYGQTASGKTFTINELSQLAVTDLIASNRDGAREVHICVFELIGKEAFDLLNTHRRISILEDSFGESQLVGITEYAPNSPDTLLSLIETAMTFRRSAPTLKNDSSSRSHAVVRFRIVNKSDPSAPDGFFFLVDLAGSEANLDSKEHSKDLMKETRDINLSLSTLKDCIRGRALWDLNDVKRMVRAVRTSIGQMRHNVVGKGNGKGFVPFRNSLLTKVLKHVFDIKSERMCKTAVLACLKPTAADAAPSKNTLRYAEMLRVPVPKKKRIAIDENIPSTWSHDFLTEWIKCNSGKPPIDAELLAPIETGIQLCKVPKGEFVSRCLKTPGVTGEQGEAFWSKLWRLHIDSRTIKTIGKSEFESIPSSQSGLVTPFIERLKPGLFFRFKNPYRYEKTPPIFMILAPEGSIQSDATDFGNKEKKERFICAEVWGVPMMGQDAYLLSVQSQRLIAKEEMESEVLMEFDTASRYYFVSL